MAGFRDFLSGLGYGGMGGSMAPMLLPGAMSGELGEIPLSQAVGMGIGSAAQGFLPSLVENPDDQERLRRVASDTAMFPLLGIMTKNRRVTTETAVDLTGSPFMSRLMAGATPG